MPRAGGKNNYSYITRGEIDDVNKKGVCDRRVELCDVKPFTFSNRNVNEKGDGKARSTQHNRFRGKSIIVTMVTHLPLWLVVFPID